MVLRLVYADLDSLFKGNSRGNASMQDLNDLIQHAAQATYRRLFELSELMAANRGSALFVQRLYQTHGSHASDQLREDATDLIARTKRRDQQVRGRVAAKRERLCLALSRRAHRF